MYKRTREEKREAAEKRNAEYAALTPAEQLKLLDARLGPGKGATKQRAKLAKQIQK